LIEINNVFKSYGGKNVLSDFSLKLGREESIGLLGDSGSGKSTILRLVSGLVIPDSGSVHISSSHIGYIFQEHRLIPWRTALENVSFSIIAGGVARKKAEIIAAEYLHKVELSGYEDYYPSQLSGGMSQRVSIARAFVIEPEILLMDEPFSALDPGLTARMNRLVAILREETSASMIYVTHNAMELENQVDSVLKLHRGGRLEHIVSYS
jgi:NitT/TauT family transport system ATP-binding protein